jgi:Spy/CpxP family protein refolding chaperone
MGRVWHTACFLKEYVRKKKLQEVSMKRWHAVLLTGFFLALATTLFAYGPGGGFGCSDHAEACIGVPEGRLDGPQGFAANLNLSKEQIDKMWQAREKFRSDTQKLRYEIFQRRLEVRGLFLDPKTDEATILSKQRDLRALRQTMSDKMVEFRLAQRKILTPEQIKKVNEFQPGHGQKGMGYGPDRGGPRGRGPGHGPCGGCDQ